MPRYLISFDDGSMDHIPDEDWPSVGEASHKVVREAKAAGIWIFGGGVQRQQSTIVATDGTITVGPVPETKAVIGGFSIIESWIGVAGPCGLTNISSRRSETLARLKQNVGGFNHESVYRNLPTSIVGHSPSGSLSMRKERSRRRARDRGRSRAPD